VTLLVIILGTGAAMAAALASPSAGKTKDPTLKPVPKVVKVKSTRKPPKNVRFRGQPMPGGITTGTGTATGGAGEVVIPGVPGYAWRDGCGPTALGMVIGYYDGQGWGDLIPGDATSQTTEVSQAIATHGTVEWPGNWEDYAQPKETTYSILPDRSQLPLGDEHASDSVADFMHTSWSADGLPYGWSFSNMVASAFSGYVKLKYPGSSSTVTTYDGPDLTWALVKQEMDASRPMVFLVDSSGDGMTDHFVTAVGYRESNGYAEYACWDTWNTGLLRWQRFRGLSDAYAWGVWGGYSFGMSGQTTVPPTPTPTPSPTPSDTPMPTPTPPPPATSDTTAPVTTQTGADTEWHNTSVTVTLAASDSESGVAYTEYSLDGGEWTRGTSLTIAVSRKTPTAAIRVLEYRSADNAGNLETAGFTQVKIDSVKPVTTSNADGLVHKGSFTLVLTPKDGDSGVAATYYKVDGAAYKAGISITVTGAGRHTVRFYSIDGAANVESTKSVTVRIG
jgi:hypothetical protein